MELQTILYPILSLGGLGLAFGAGLAYASQKFAVQVDPKIEAIMKALPGANCGGCGFPGCSGFAQALFEGRAKAEGCPPGGPDCAQKLAEIMCVEAGVCIMKNTAKVLCNGDTEKCKEKHIYKGVQDCSTAAMFDGGSKACGYGCMGLGTCVDVCPFDAIEIVEGRLARIISDKCTACGKCIEVCPKNVIGLVPYEQNVIIACNNRESGKIVKQKCSVGCIACKICVKACPENAIDFEDNLASINYAKCTQCYICVEKCPTKAIEADLEKTA